MVKGGDERRKFREGIQMCRKRAKHKKTAVFKELKKKLDREGKECMRLEANEQFSKIENKKEKSAYRGEGTVGGCLLMTCFSRLLSQ